MLSAEAEILVEMCHCIYVSYDNPIHTCKVGVKDRLMNICMNENQSGI